MGADKAALKGRSELGEEHIKRKQSFRQNAPPHPKTRLWGRYHQTCAGATSLAPQKQGLLTEPEQGCQLLKVSTESSAMRDVMSLFTLPGPARPP